MEKYYSLGIDFGTNSVRALLLDLMTGKEIAAHTADYPSGDRGILTDSNNPHLARQYPGDYSASMKNAVRETIQQAADKSISLDKIMGVGIDATGSTPLPVDKSLTPLGMREEFRDNLNAQAWLWKDHTAEKEAREITDLASRIRPHYLKKCGGAYSSEWFFSKILHCYKIDRPVFEAAYSWMELSDFIPALLCGTDDFGQVKRNVCAAGHKAMYSQEWGGLPDKEFLDQLSPDMAGLRDRLYNTTYTSDTIAGYLTEEWTDAFGLPHPIPVAVGMIDAHSGAVGAGVGRGILVKIIGTSTCDIMVFPREEWLEDIPGVAGIVNGSVLPGYIGIEAGQSAVGDIFNWFVSAVLGEDEEYHHLLTREATGLKAGQSGLLALDWNNGNRNILADYQLTGLLVGQTLHTTDYEIYRALIEATAFGARRIIERMEEYGVTIDKVINCGGIAEKNPLVMQIYADVLNRPMALAGSHQTVAMGAAILGGAAALKDKQGFRRVEDIQKRVCQITEKVFYPDKDAAHVYDKLYSIYLRLHDGFGISQNTESMFTVMKDLLQIKGTL